jgi:hypothetical protein
LVASSTPLRAEENSVSHQEAHFFPASLFIFSDSAGHCAKWWYDSPAGLAANLLHVPGSDTT